MRIKSTNVNTSSTNLSTVTETSQEHLKAWDKDQIIELTNTSMDTATSAIVSASDLLTLQKDAEKDELTESSTYLPPKTQVQQEVVTQPVQIPSSSFGQAISDGYDSKTNIMKMIIESFSHKKIKLFKLDLEGNSTGTGINGLNVRAAATEEVEVLSNYIPLQIPQQSTQVSDNTTPQWGIDYTYTATKHSRDMVTYNAEGSVTTEDNRLIRFDTNLNMSRQSYQSNTTQIKQGAALIDPLVLNLSGGDEILDDEKFSFDLDMDGEAEEIATLKSGKAFLALDRNNNGQIDNGYELFGPKTNQGFSELAELDSDHNNWIDENDERFYELKLWERTADGSTLTSLLERGVGAIYLGSEETTYDLLTPSSTDTPSELAAGMENTGSTDEELAGRLKETSFFLNENGTSGLIHEIDLTA